MPEFTNIRPIGGKGFTNVRPIEDEPAPPPEKPSALGFGKNLVSSAGRLVGDVAKAVTSPRQTLTALGGLGVGAVQKLIPGEQPQERYADAFGQFYKERYGNIDKALRSAYEDPIGVAADISTVAGGAGVALRAGGAGKAARVAGLVAETTDPFQAVGRMAGASIPKKIMGDAAKRLYESSLKSSLAQKKIAERPRIIEAGLNNRIPVSKGGSEKLADMVDATNQKITDAVAAGTAQGITINKIKVSSRLRDTFDKFRQQVNPSADLTAIRESGKDFLVSQPKAIPLDKAQALKVGTYRQLKSKSYGELKSASIESQKALARGLKEEIAAAFPEIAELNAKESELLRLEPVLEHAVARIRNKDLIGIGTPIVGTAVGLGTGSAKAAGAAAILKSILDNPNVKSRLAILLNRAAQSKPARFGTGKLTAISRIQAYRDSIDDSE